MWWCAPTWRADARVSGLSDGLPSQVQRGVSTAPAWRELADWSLPGMQPLAHRGGVLQEMLLEARGKHEEAAKLIQKHLEDAPDCQMLLKRQARLDTGLGATLISNMIPLPGRCACVPHQKGLMRITCQAMISSSTWPLQTCWRSACTRQAPSAMPQHASVCDNTFVPCGGPGFVFAWASFAHEM